MRKLNLKIVELLIKKVIVTLNLFVILRPLNYEKYSI